ncbi:MAG: GrpB family protein [Muribaculaceae bacterium]|nr:GrpB family protein [Muribaculaceae bacterium]
MKDLKDLTLEELWELFPIVLSPHRSEWIAWAREEIGILAALLHEYSPRIHHIGSTAIPGIMAKPTVDILVETGARADYAAMCGIMERAGYMCMNESAARMSFNKGYTPQGYAERVFHIHFHRAGDNDEILFRDYLIAHPATAREYERLKQSLLPAFRNDRDGYTEAKTAFVSRITALARKSTH